MHSRSSDQKQLVHSNGQDDIHCTSNSITSIKSGSRNNEYMVYLIEKRHRATLSWYSADDIWSIVSDLTNIYVYEICGILLDVVKETKRVILVIENVHA